MINPYVKRFCKRYTEIENYEKAISDTTQTWICHHRLETSFTVEELKKAKKYYDRPPEELIFLKVSEHNFNSDIHISYEKKGRIVSDETRAKMSKAHAGKTPWNKGLKGKTSWSDEQRKKYEEKLPEIKEKLSKANKGKKLSDETKQKMKGRKAFNQGLHMFNNGIKIVFAKECPDGFVPGKIKKEERYAENSK